MMDLYTNRISKNDFIKHGIIEYVENGMDILGGKITLLGSANLTRSAIFSSQ
ncbi:MULTISPECIES: hypothetical protein [Vibrio]|uniref:hypothetical protein n=1 Tax=Vibrio TaxID=662 RepID=UPI00355062C0